MGILFASVGAQWQAQKHVKGTVTAFWHALIENLNWQPQSHIREAYPNHFVCFLTLFKKPLTPPPRFEHVRCNFFNDFLKSVLTSVATK